MAERLPYGRGYAPYRNEIYYDTGVGSIFSEVVNKVVGKKAGKKLEKGTKKFTSEAAGITKKVALMVPGAGTAVAAGVDLFTEYKDLGARASKMSDGRIAEIALTNPVKAQALMQAKQAVMTAKAAKQAAKRAAKQTQQMKRFAMSVPAPVPAPAPKPSIVLPLLIIGGGVIYVLSQKPATRRRKR